MFLLLESNVVLILNYTSNPDYSTRVLLSGRYTLHWKFVNDEIEIAIEGKTFSWIGIGWKPTELSFHCKKFPQPPTRQAEDLTPDVNSDSSHSMVRFMRFQHLYSDII